MEGIRLILNDGTVIEDGRAGYSTGSVVLMFTGYTLQEAIGIVFDPSKTSRITFQYGEMEDVYEGYTNCVNVGIDGDGEITAIMEKGGD